MARNERESDHERNPAEAALKVVKWVFPRIFRPYIRRKHLFKDVTVNLLYLGSMYMGINSINQSCEAQSLNERLGQATSTMRASTDPMEKHLATLEVGELSEKRTLSIGEAALGIFFATGALAFASRIDSERGSSGPGNISPK